MLKRFLVICLLLCYLPSVATATDYMITEQQLTRLETNLIQLKQTNEQLQKELEMLRQRSKNQEISLMNVSQSFDKYAASQQAKLRKTKAERNFLIVLLLGSIVAMAGK